jgi:hypothetical protein
MKLSLPDVSQQATWDLAKRFVVQAINSLTQFSQHGVSFTDNIDAQQVTVSFTTANTEVQVAHTLSRVPTGYIPANLSVAMTVYNSATAFSTSNIYLKSTVAGTAILLIY